MTLKDPFIGERLNLIVKGLPQLHNVVILAKPCDWPQWKLLKDLVASDPKKESKRNSLTKANVNDSRLSTVTMSTKNKGKSAKRGKGGN